MDKICGKCGGALNAGFTTALLGFGPRIEDRKSKLLFVELGNPSSLNPIAAFQQGLREEPGDTAYLIDGYRCSKCGSLELYAEKPH
ncbi:MAG: hypothetical protein U0872_02635 [Planctomycetaceae bacterium]